jgi:NADPH:quinone reductase-like Zn-dependent oxidoreductase
MKAVLCTRYGPPEVLRLADVPTPVPGDREVQVRIVATTVTRGDVRMRGFDVPAAQWLPARLYLGIFRPKRAVLGMSLAGIVESTGKEVTRFKAGDAVFASTFGAGFGGHAEYKCLPEDGMLALLPAGTGFEEAAAIPGGSTTALRVIRKAEIEEGQSVLVYGASGAVGTCAVQLARHFGATVTGVCSSANLELVRSLGADQVLDYSRGELTGCADRFDVFVDAVGKTTASQGRRHLKESGRYLNVHAASGHGEAFEEFLFVRDLVAAGRLRTVIDRTYPLERIVEAHRYVDTGHKKGNVVITVGHANGSATDR